MNSTVAALFFLAVVVVIFLLKQAGLISPKQARAHLKGGAILVDVRSASEFKAGHLQAAINFPLEGIEETLPRRVKDRSQVLLLHCKSGMRSGLATKKLKAMGYVRAFNLGSYHRAATVVNGA